MHPAHNYTSCECVCLLLSLLLRGMCLYVRVMGLRLLTHSDCLPRKPTSPAHLYSARNCLACTPHPCPPSDEAHSLCYILGAAGRCRLIRERPRPGSPLLGSPLLVATRSVVHMSYLLSVAKSSGLEMSFCGCLRYAEDKEGPTGHC